MLQVLRTDEREFLFPLKVFQVDVSHTSFSHTSLTDGAASTTFYQPLLLRIFSLWSVLEVATVEDLHFYGFTISVGVCRGLAKKFRVEKNGVQQ